MYTFTTVLSVFFYRMRYRVRLYRFFVRNRDKDKGKQCEARRDRFNRDRIHQGEHGRNQGGAEGTAKDEYGVRNALDRR